MGCGSWGHDAGLPFYQMVIQFDGRVILCCMDVAQEVVVGSVARQSLRSVWGSGEFLRLVDRIYSGRISSDDHFLCNRCPSAVYGSTLRDPQPWEVFSAKVASAFSRHL